MVGPEDVNIGTCIVHLLISNSLGIVGIFVDIQLSQYDLQILASICSRDLQAAVRRLHDKGRSGLWNLIGLIPVLGLIVLIVFMVEDSKPDNQYGPNPKAAVL